jgi:diguanylate cyclase (GGDEF)-like protein
VEKDASEPRLDVELGLYPQPILQTLLVHEVARIKRYPSPLSLMYLALQFSSSPTDDIIHSARLWLANLLHSRLREVDMPGHFEGNYMVALPNTDITGARTAASRLIKMVRGKQRSLQGREYEIAICVGIATLDGGPSASLAELLSQTASALWEAERRGPQSLVTFDELTSS